MSSENIVTGKKYRVLTDATNKVWNRISFWCKASDVEFNSGSNAQTTLGSITGISDSLTSTSSNVAASAASVKALNDKITELSSNINSGSVSIPLKINCYEYNSNGSLANYSKAITITVNLETGAISAPGTVFYNGDGFRGNDSAAEFRTEIKSNGTATVN